MKTLEDPSSSNAIKHGLAKPHLWNRLRQVRKENVPKKRGPRPVQVHKDWISRLLATACDCSESRWGSLINCLAHLIFSGYKENRTVPEAAREKGGQIITQIAEVSLSTHMYTLSNRLRQGKETKRETLLKQVKDVDELMNEEHILACGNCWSHLKKFLLMFDVCSHHRWTHSRHCFDVFITTSQMVCGESHIPKGMYHMHVRTHTHTHTILVAVFLSHACRCIYTP